MPEPLAGITLQRVLCAAGNGEHLITAHSLETGWDRSYEHHNLSAAGKQVMNKNVL